MGAPVGCQLGGADGSNWDNGVGMEVCVGDAVVFVAMGEGVGAASFGKGVVVVGVFGAVPLPSLPAGLLSSVSPRSGDSLLRLVEGFLESAVPTTAPTITAVTSTNPISKAIMRHFFDFHRPDDDNTPRLMLLLL